MAGVSQAARVGVVVGRTLATTSCDADVIDYVAGIVAQVLSEGTATPQVLVDAVGPVLEGSAMSEADIATVCAAMCKALAPTSATATATATATKASDKTRSTPKLLSAPVCIGDQLKDDSSSKKEQVEAETSAGTGAATGAAAAGAGAGATGATQGSKAGSRRTRKGGRRVGKKAARRARRAAQRQKAASKGSEEDESESGASASDTGSAGSAASHKSAAKADDAAATMDGDWDNDDADEWGTTTNVAFRSRGRAQVGESQDVSLHSFQLSVKGKDLLVGTKLLLHKGHRYGLVGRNGVGKSTLLRRMARYQIAGFPTHLRTLHVKQEVVGTDCKVLDAMLSADTERAALLAEEDALLASAADDQPERLIEIYERLAELDADSAEDRARKILRGLQFTDEMMLWPTKQLSGGWRMRLALARALFVHPDILMLDEPTNHVDLPAVIWLQNYLATLKTIVVVVSHDRAFLNAVATDIVHFHRQQLHYYPGNFDAFEKARNDKLAKQRHMQESLDRQRAHMEDSIKKMKQKALKNVKDHKRLSLVASREKKLLKWGQQKTDDGKKWNCQKHGYRPGSINANAAGWKGRKMQRASLVEAPDKSVVFGFQADDSCGTSGPLLQLEEVAFAYPKTGAAAAAAATGAGAGATTTTTAATAGGAGGGAGAGAGAIRGVAPPALPATKPGSRRRRRGRKAAMDAAAAAAASRRIPGMVLSDVTLGVEAGSRIGILGANGAGKSTLLKLLSGELEPTRGMAHRNGKIKVAHFTQHHVDQLDLTLTPLEHMAKEFPLLKELEIRAHLGSFGIKGKLASQVMGTLSGGQKSRVVFAQLSYTRPHILVCDEPSNHMDFASIDALVEALKAFKGGIIIVSHDQALISSVCTELWEVADGLVTRMDGTWADYVASVLSRAKIGPTTIKLSTECLL